MEFGRSHIYRLVKAVDFLLHTGYVVYDDGRAWPDRGEVTEDWEPWEPSPKWDSLSREQRVEVLNRYIDWRDFGPEQADKLIDNIASGKERIRWFDDVSMGSWGYSEHHHQQWLEFEKLPEEEQLREAARLMKNSLTLSLEDVRVPVKWAEMNDEQRFDAIVFHLDTRAGSDMSYRQREEILKEELGCCGDGRLVRADQALQAAFAQRHDHGHEAGRIAFADSFDALMTRLEAFGDEFARLAFDREQMVLAEEFGEFVGEAHAVIATLGEAKPSMAAERRSPGEIAHDARLDTPDAFDDIAANLRQHWYDDGLGYAGDRWENQPVLYKLAYLADFAGALGVSFERYAAAARQTLGMTPGEEFSAEHDWYLKHEFDHTRQHYARRRAEAQPRPAQHPPSPSEIGAMPDEGIGKGHGQEREIPF